MKTKNIRQSITFRAAPKEVYEALMDSRKHSRFTGSKASISRKVHGKIMAYDGYITGTNLELLPARRIVQSWHANDSCWKDKEHYSKATFSLKKTRIGTRLTFFQSGVPESCYKSIKQGWWDSYWNPMKKMLENQ